MDPAAWIDSAKAFANAHPYLLSLLSILIVSAPQWISSVWSLFSGEPLFVWLSKTRLGKRAAPILRILPVVIGAPLLLAVGWFYTGFAIVGVGVLTIVLL